MAKSETVAAASAIRTIETEARGLGLLRDALSNGLAAPFSAAVDAILTATGRVIVTGMGKSGHVGRKIAATLASTGTAAHFVHPGEASHGDLGMIRAEDIIIALSWSGAAQELSDIISYSRRHRVTLIAITSGAESPLGSNADIALVLPKAEEACPNGLAPTTSTTLQIAIGDALAVALLEARGFTKDDFREFHPGGKLGAQLKQVRDIMHRGDRLPLVLDHFTVGEAILEISAKGFGCAVVVNEAGALAGIITDGDLRRNLRSDVMALPVTAIMTKSPRTIRPDLLLGAAIEFQERHKITALIVVEDGRPVGLVHYLDLLRAGAA